MSKGEKRPLSEAMKTAQHITGVLSDYCQRTNMRDDNRWHKYIHAKEASQTEESK